MKYYQSLEAIVEADVEDILKVPTMNRQAAEEVYEFFHKDFSH
jgi:excinuclease ABC subunit C